MNQAAIASQPYTNEISYRNALNMTYSSRVEPNGSAGKMFMRLLKHLYCIERNRSGNWDMLADAASSTRLKGAIRIYTRRGFAGDIEEIFESIGEAVESLESDEYDSLLEKAMEDLSAEEDAVRRDEALISYSQKLMHHKLNDYGSLRTLAIVLNYSEA